MSQMLHVDSAGGVLEVSFLEKNILDESNIQQIGQELGDALEGKASPQMIIDFGNVEHLSSAALGILITMNNRIGDMGGRMCLANIRPQIFEVFKITKLDRIFTIHETAQAARDDLS
ncbi:MAG: STAS domain-containing protein [Phycisphaerales bacterium]|nr:STAS domain-containing protein [Phycisphaerales bacterium]